MADQYRSGSSHSPGDFVRKYKDIGADPVTGERVFAPVYALESGSIGGGGGGPASKVTVADGTIDTQLLAVDAVGRITALISGTVPVSGTFWQATQPVSIAATVSDDPVDRAARLLGHVTVDNASLAVTQSTSPWVVDTELPAASALGDIEGNPTVPRVGAMGMLWNGLSWDRVPGDSGSGLKVQTTQLPTALVGGRLDVNLGTWRGSTAPTVGQKTMVNSLPMAIASDQSAVPVSGTVTANAGTGPFPVSDNAGSLTVDAPVGTPLFARLSDGAAALVGQKTMANSLPVVLASDETALGITPPTLTKGTQGATGFSVQDLKDSGRVTICLTVEFAFAQTAETLLTVTESRDGAATATFTSKTITSGKRIRFLGGFGILETLGTGTTVPQRMYLRLRVNTAGATTAASPLQFVWGLGIPTGSAAIPVKSTGFEPIMIPDGVEYLGNGTVTYGLTLETPDWVVTTGTGRCKITLFAFEY